MFPHQKNRRVARTSAFPITAKWDGQFHQQFSNSIYRAGIEVAGLSYTQCRSQYGSDFNSNAKVQGFTTSTAISRSAFNPAEFLINRTVSPSVCV